MRLAHRLARTEPPARERRIHVYGVGLPRSGTTSLHTMFARSGYRSDHEPLAFDFLPRMRKRRRQGAIRRYLQRRDAYLNLEVESSHFLFEVAPILAEMYPDARFVLSTRDCYSWLQSVIHRESRSPTSTVYPFWLVWNRRFTGGRTTQALLEDGGLPYRPDRDLLRRYFAYWGHHHRTVQNGVPEERLFVAPTAQLREAAAPLGEFVGAEEPIRPVAVQNVSRRKGDDLSEVDLDYLTDIAEESCGDVMAQHFPEIRHAGDALT